MYKSKTFESHIKIILKKITKRITFKFFIVLTQTIILKNVKMFTKDKMTTLR